MVDLFYNNYFSPGHHYNQYFFKPKQTLIHDKNKKENLTLFLENLMVRYGVLYTLIGTKPVTEFDIEETIEETEEDIKQSYLDLKEFIEKKGNDVTDVALQQVKLPTYEEFRLRCIKNRKLLGHLNHKKLWLDFRKHIGVLDPKFCILDKKSPYTERPFGLFVNIPNLVYTLYHYRTIFMERTELTYNPEEIVFQIKDEDSVFWNRVFKDHFLSGLIYGYGERSAYLFEWSDKHLKTNKKEKGDFACNEEQLKKRVKLIVKTDIQVSDLSLPEFFYFGVTDSKMSEYRSYKRDHKNFNWRSIYGYNVIRKNLLDKISPSNYHLISSKLCC